MGNGNGKNFVRYAERSHKAMKSAEIFIEFLGKGDTHERIADIDDELGQSHFDKAAACGYDSNSGNLSGRGEVGKRDADSGKQGNARPVARIPNPKDTER